MVYDVHDSFILVSSPWASIMIQLVLFLGFGIEGENFTGPTAKYNDSLGNTNIVMISFNMISFSSIPPSAATEGWSPLEFFISLLYNNPLLDVSCIIFLYFELRGWSAQSIP